MGKYKNKAYSLRINEELMEKVKAIAKNENRYVSQQLENMIKKEVEEYENKHGKINIKNVNIVNTNNGTINME